MPTGTHAICTQSLTKKVHLSNLRQRVPVAVAQRGAVRQRKVQRRARGGGAGVASGATTSSGNECRLHEERDGGVGRGACAVERMQEQAISFVWRPAEEAGVGRQQHTQKTPTHCEIELEQAPSQRSGGLHAFGRGAALNTCQLMHAALIAVCSIQMPHTHSPIAPRQTPPRSRWSGSLWRWAPGCRPPGPTGKPPGPGRRVAGQREAACWRLP